MMYCHLGGKFPYCLYTMGQAISLQCPMSCVYTHSTYIMHVHTFKTWNSGPAFILTW